MELKKAKDIATTQVKILVYGSSGSQKSRFATNDAKNGIVLDFERGLGSIDNKDIDVLECKVARDFTESLEYLSKDKEHDTVIIDSWSEYGRYNICPAV